MINNTMKTYFLTSTLCIMLTFNACDGAGNKKIVNTPKKKPHLNLMICSDLSNRLTVHEQHIDDTTLIGSLLDFYFEEDKIKDIYHSNGRKKGQKDRIGFVLLNNGNIKKCSLKIDRPAINLEQFMKKGQRVQYLNGSKDDNFKRDKIALKKEIAKLYKYAFQKPEGANIYRFFKSELPLPEPSEGVGYRNILILFTDGYIEYNSKQKGSGNKTYYLNQSLVQKFRQAYNEQKTKDDTLSLIDFFYQSGYGLVPINNPQLEHIEVLAIEFNDRSKNEEPADQEIIQLFWEDWMKKSKVKHFKSHTMVGNLGDFKNHVFEFIEHK